MTITIKQTTLAIAALVFTAGASANITHSLKKVCNNAKQAEKSTVSVKLKDIQSDYRRKLAQNYTAMSCDGKNLMLTVLTAEEPNTNTLVDRKILK